MADTDLMCACSTVVEEYLSAFRVVILNGPRQAGKTTLLRHMQREHGGTLLNLDNEQLRQAAVSDPLAFASSGEEPRFIDEVQRAGDALVRAIKAEVDSVPTPGRYLLAGSLGRALPPLGSDSVPLTTTRAAK